MLTRRALQARRLGRAIVAAGALGTLAMTATPTRGSSLPAIGFGVDIGSLGTSAAQSVPFAYGTFWVGAWTQKHGWDYARRQLAEARARQVTPVINWWYWGDDISPACVEQGCQDPRQGVWKDRATWYRMSAELADLIARESPGRETIVVLETEFNKGGIETHEPFDGYLAEVAGLFHRHAGIRVVIGFGNWGQRHWQRFDRAMAEADYLGTQLLRSSVREPATYLGAVSTLVEGARHLHRTFHKPVFIVDFAVSSYPAATYEDRQAAVTRQLFERIGELEAAGVRGLAWRMIADDPAFDTSNYHGIAERHWGFVRADGSAKPAFQPLAAGVRAAADRAPLAP